MHKQCIQSRRDQDQEGTAHKLPCQVLKERTFADYFVLHFWRRSRQGPLLQALENMIKTTGRASKSTLNQPFLAKVFCISVSHATPHSSACLTFPVPFLIEIGTTESFSISWLLERTQVVTRCRICICKFKEKEKRQQKITTRAKKKKAIHFEHVSGFSFVAKKSAPSTTEGTRKRRMTTLQSDTLKKVR